jgi:1-acyl-sn-glycerol-3-phosphate acyltransferase
MSIRPVLGSTLLLSGNESSKGRIWNVSQSCFLLLLRGRTAMFVANHNSWMDIPFLGASIGFRNYKLISKAELGKVPILGKSIKVGGNIMVDRLNPRSQVKTLKAGIQYLKDGVLLCTYPEGTRTKTGRLTKFKNGAFKMALKAGAPVIPISIVGAANVMPTHWMFPYRPAHNVAKVVIHKPVESAGITENELAAAVRKSMITGLPPDQRPEDE